MDALYIQLSVRRKEFLWSSKMKSFNPFHRIEASRDQERAGLVWIAYFLTSGDGIRNLFFNLGALRMPILLVLVFNILQPEIC